jgi:hypothetical protein
MGRSSAWLMAIFGAGSVLPALVSAQAVVAGTVLQDGTNRPLPGVEVLMEKRKRQVYTNASGHFSFADVPRGDHVLLFRSVGFRPVRYMARVLGTDTVLANARLVAFAVTLEPVKVTAPSPSSSMGVGGFTERRNLGFGVFVDSSELRRNDNIRLGDLMGRLPGVQVQRSRDGIYAVSMSQVGPFGERCPMSLMVDGALLYRSVGIQMHTKESVPGPREMPPDLNSFLGLSDLQAVEIYRRASEVPLEFGGRTAVCGIIVLWTRRAR